METQTEALESHAGAFRIIDLAPKISKTEVPVIIAGGWGETSEVFEDSIAELNSLNRRVISLDYPRHGGIIKSMKDDSSIDEFRKAVALHTVLDKKGIEKADVIAHSEGAINTVIAASLRPAKFRNIVLVNPAGMIGKDTVPRLLGRFAIKQIKAYADLDNPRVRKGQIEGTKYALQNLRRSYKEVKAISQSEVQDIIKDLQGQGINVVVIHSVDDPVFPMDRVQENAGKSNLKGFISVKGPHDAIYTHPEKYTRLAEQTLSALEGRESKDSDSVVVAK